MSVQSTWYMKRLLQSKPMLFCASWIKCYDGDILNLVKYHLAEISSVPEVKHTGSALHPWWRHQMETFSALLALCAVNSPVTGEYPSQRLWRGTLMFSLICAWTNGWVNTRDASDFRRHHTHCDVTVMQWWIQYWRHTRDVHHYRQHNMIQLWHIFWGTHKWFDLIYRFNVNTEDKL